MSEKAINFYQGKVCIRSEDGSLSFKNDECIPELKLKIDEYIKDNPRIFNTKKIIFDVLKEYFGIYKTFITPCSNHYIPHSDSLYNELLHYVSSNPIFTNKVDKKTKTDRQRKKDYNSNIKKVSQYNRYLKDKNKYFFRQTTIYGKRG